MPGRVTITLLERVLILLASVALSVGLIALMSGFFAGRDRAGLTGATTGGGLGEHFADLGAGTLARGELHPPYSSDPPTSGAHVPTPLTRDDAVLSTDQILTALAAGDVVILYGPPRPPPALQALAQAIAGPFTPALARSGQAVVLGRRTGTSGLIALAWTRMLRTGSPRDPNLRAFAEQWLGQASAGR